LPKILHIESTDVCQAACPQCLREVDVTFNKKIQHHLSLEQIKSLFSDDFIRGLDKMYMCGSYGDPAAGRHTIEIFKYFRSINPNIILGMNTNGSINDTQWWSELAKIINGIEDYVVFSIDGLEDTNHIYRKNVIWSKLIKNTQAFIAAGGAAQWDMLIFDHNKHQVESCQQLAKDLGFRIFRAKVSRRHTEYPVEFLKAPTGWKDPSITGNNIDCIALSEDSVYISAQGIVHPCCWLGVNNGPDINEFTNIKQSWTVNPHPICKKTCSKHELGNSFKNQWQREILLK
jgi:MoaA/NifB/PqqE/SkfB family radical SAM enzyme